MMRRMKSVFAGILSVGAAFTGIQLIPAAEGDCTKVIPAAEYYFVIELPEEKNEEVGDPAEKAVDVFLTHQWNVFCEEKAEKPEEATEAISTEEMTLISQEETDIESISEIEAGSTEEETDEERDLYYIELALCHETKEPIGDKDSEKAFEEMSESATETFEEETDPYSVYRILPDDYGQAECFEVVANQKESELGLYTLSFGVNDEAEVWRCYFEEMEEEDLSVSEIETETEPEGTEKLCWMEPVECHEILVEEQVQRIATLETVSDHWVIVHMMDLTGNAGIDVYGSMEEGAAASLEGYVYAETVEDQVPMVVPTTADQVTQLSTMPATQSTMAAALSATAQQQTMQTTTAAAAATVTTAAPVATAAPVTTAATVTSAVPVTTAASVAAVPTATELQPITTAHEHVWIPVTSVVHHEAVYQSVWVEDIPAWEEQVLESAAWDENRLISEAWDEPFFGYVAVCNKCGHQFWTAEDSINLHMIDGCWASWHHDWLQIGTTHHEAVYQIIHHEAVYRTVHHEAEGHYENVVVESAWDETITTGSECMCGAVR